MPVFLETRTRQLSCLSRCASCILICILYRVLLLLYETHFFTSLGAGHESPGRQLESRKCRRSMQGGQLIVRPHHMHAVGAVVGLPVKLDCILHCAGAKPDVLDV